MLSLPSTNAIDGPSPPGGTLTNEDDDEIQHVHNIEGTLCPSCSGPNAHTRILPTNIPYFRQVIIISADCPDCHFRDSQVDFGSVQSKGERITLTIKNNFWSDVLKLKNRQIVKSDSATISIPTLDLELPPKTQSGINTIEGLLTNAANNLDSLQAERLRMGDVDNFHRCRGVISKLRRILGTDIIHDDDEDDDSCASDNSEHGNEDQSYDQFTIILDDPAGNSFIENPHAPKSDPHLTCERYNRTSAQDKALGLQSAIESTIKTKAADGTGVDHSSMCKHSSQQHHFEVEEDRLQTEDGSKPMSIVHGESMIFPTDCPHCHVPAETNMCVTKIPHFKEVIIMCLLCEQCGYKSNEIKGGGAIPEFGTKCELYVKDAQDLKREVLKSDTAGISVPELDLELQEGGMDGVYTTVEGLLIKMHDRLRDAQPFGMGDAAIKQHANNDGTQFSAPSAEHIQYMGFLTRLKDIASGKHFPFTLIITDPLSNSFVGSHPDRGRQDVLSLEGDEGLSVEEFERTEEQNESLGLNDLKT